MIRVTARTQGDSVKHAILVWASIYCPMYMLNLRIGLDLRALVFKLPVFKGDKVCIISTDLGSG